jgi:hypothetical protein
MYLFSKTSARSKPRGKTARYRAKLKAKNRRRVNRMAGKKMSRSLYKKS